MGPRQHDAAGLPVTKIDRTRIVGAAIAIVERGEKGELTLTAIARELEVTQPALYYHVDGIEDVWRGLGAEVRTRLATDLTAATIGRSNAEAVRAGADAWRSFAHRHPELYRSTDWYLVEGDEDLERAVAQMLDVLVGTLRGFDLADQEREHAALALHSMLHGFVSFELGTGNPTQRRAEDSFAAVVDLLISGLLVLSEPPRTHIGRNGSESTGPGAQG